MTTVSDEDLRQRLKAVLKDVDLETTTERQIRQQLEGEYGCSLKDRKPIFKAEIELYLESQAETVEDEEDDEPVAKKQKRAPGGNQQLSEAMQAFLGVGPDDVIGRREVVKKLWEYIKLHNLQDPANKRNIILDDKLKTLFSPPVNMFSINKQISKHVKSASDLAGGDAAPRARPKAKKPAKSKAANADGDGKEKKASGFAKPLKISPDLAAVVGKEAVSRGECTKLLWAYVKEKGLQNPENRSIILVSKDAQLHKVLGVDSCTGFSMTKYLKDHFLGPAE